MRMSEVCCTRQALNSESKAGDSTDVKSSLLYGVHIRLSRNWAHSYRHSITSRYLIPWRFPRAWKACSLIRLNARIRHPSQSLRCQVCIIWNAKPIWNLFLPLILYSPSSSELHMGGCSTGFTLMWAFLPHQRRLIFYDTINQGTDASHRQRPSDALRAVINCVSNGRLNQNVRSKGGGAMQCNLGYGPAWATSGDYQSLSYWVHARARKVGRMEGNWTATNETQSRMLKLPVAPHY